MSTKLHVGNVPATVEEHELREAFGRFGQVDAVEIPRDSITGRGKGFAIVAMSQALDADSAIRTLNFSQFDGRTIGVSRARHTGSGAASAEDGGDDPGPRRPGNGG